jgi:hypothetical protein
LYLAELRRLWGSYGKENIVYIDESGFEEEVARRHAWAPRGRKVYGEIAGSKRKRTNLIMAQKRQEWLAPMVFECSCNAELVETWLEKMLLPELTQPSVIVMDNAAFHHKERISKLLKQHGHKLLPLPPYSPDFNHIEQSFAILKRRREFALPLPTLEELLMSDFGFA